MIVLGHRGGRGEGFGVENSLAAFQRALDEGADGVELDVRLCASGEPVVVHDPTFSRVTDAADERPVHLVPTDDLPLFPSGGSIPLLAEALDLCSGRIVNVEVKADVPSRLRLVRAVARELARARRVDVVVSSFDPAIVLAFAAVLPRVERAILVGPRTPRLATLLPLAMRRAVSAAHLEDGLLAEARVHRLRRAGVRVAAWTVNEPARARELERHGVDWVITDRTAAIVSGLSAESGFPAGLAAVSGRR